MLKFYSNFSDKKCTKTHLRRYRPDPRSPGEATSNVAGEGASNAGKGQEGGRDGRNKWGDTGIRPGGKGKEEERQGKKMG